MYDNKTLLKNKVEFLKAMVALPNITLSPAEADKFIDYIWETSAWQDHARMVKMDKTEKNIRYLGFSSTKKALVPAAGFTSADYIKTFDEGKVTLTSHKFRGCLTIWDDDLEDGIEGDAFGDHLMRIMATQISNQLDDFYYSANTSSTGFSSTDIRHMTNGWRYDLLNFSPDSGTIPGVATELDASSTSDFSIAGGIAEVSTGAPYSTEFKFAKMLSSLDSKYKAVGRNNLRFFCPDEVADDYGKVLTDRGTALGDKAITDGAPMKFNRVPVVPIPNMSHEYQTGSAGTEEMTGGTFSDCFLTPKNNLIIGIHRGLRLESKREPADECTYVFYSIRVDMAVECPNACVFLHDITTT